MDDRGHTVAYMPYVFFNALNSVQITPFNAVNGVFQHVGTLESKVVAHHMGVFAMDWADCCKISQCFQDCREIGEKHYGQILMVFKRYNI